MHTYEADGRIIKADPVMATGKKGGQYTKFSVAVESGFGNNKTVTFVNCVAFGEIATQIAKHCKRGSGVHIKGEPTFRAQNDKVFIDVSVFYWRFTLSNKPQESAPESPKEEPPPKVEPPLAPSEKPSERSELKESDWSEDELSEVPF